MMLKQEIEEKVKKTINVLHCDICKETVNKEDIISAIVGKRGESSISMRDIQVDFHYTCWDELSKNFMYRDSKYGE